MDGSNITGYAALTKGAVLTPFTYKPPPLGGHDVRIDITHCGLCGTDIQGIENYYQIVEYPFVPGHEIVGHISEVGTAVSSSRLGERVGVGWQGRACMQCEWCLKGDVHLCMKVADNGSWLPYGGFSSSVVVNEGFAYSLPEEMPSEVAAVMMCAGITVYAALHRYCSAPSLRIGIVGIGGLGHLAIQFAKAMGYEVTAISSSPHKRAEAISLGADWFITISDQAALDKAADHFDLLYVTAHGGIAWEEMVKILKRKGKMVLSGFPDINLSSVDLVAHELSIVGSFLGTQTEMREMLQFAQAHAVQPMIELMPMSQVNEAIERLKQNKARYRIVLVNDQE
ncbi:MAG: NAD(P)-dependent alcohol dehydrogenase [Chloroflexota bacterium]|nr:NAD(P)-dependent alcohol dehydrogenase [Chloroflexota bacterium]